MNFEGQLSEKSSFKFGEVASMAGVKPYVLRFWESEFDQIKPTLSESGSKIYSKSDVQLIKKIKKYLFDEKMSIPQVKAVLDKVNEEVVEVISPIIENLEQIDKNIIDEVKVTNPKNVSCQQSSLELMRAALGEDLDQYKKVVYTKQLNDKEILKIVQAKKKLSNVLTKINSIIEINNWN